MERRGDIIFFDSAEQADLSLPEMTTAEDAAQIAHGYFKAATRLNQRSIEAINDAYFDQDPTVLIEVKPLSKRATQLSTFAAGVMRLCPAEYVTVMAKEQQEPTQ